MLIFTNKNKHFIFIHIPKNGGKYIREKILNEWTQTRFITPFAFAGISLGFFWIVSFLFLRTSKWAQSGE